MKSRKNLFLLLTTFIVSGMGLYPVSIDTCSKDKLSKGNFSIEKNIFLKSQKTLIYNSTFGKTYSSIQKKDSLYIMTTKGEDFFYRQTYMMKNDGIYIYETYQKMSPMIFVEIEDLFTYSRPVLRIPLPFTPNKNWEWKGLEYNDGDENNLTITGKIRGKESIKTKAGIFETIVFETSIVSSSGTKNLVREWISEELGVIKSEIEINGGGVMGMLRDLLGYGRIFFELEEIK
ncbi:MAG: hypothetical protein V1720_15805 [bacterium]